MLKDVRCIKCGSLLQIDGRYDNYHCPVCRRETIVVSGDPVTEGCYTHIPENVRTVIVDDTLLSVCDGDSFEETSVKGFNIIEVRTNDFHVGYFMRSPAEKDIEFYARVFCEAMSSVLVEDLSELIFIGVSANTMKKLQGV